MSKKNREIRRVPAGWEHPMIDDPAFPSPYWRHPEDLLHSEVMNESYVKTNVPDRVVGEIQEVDLDDLEKRRSRLMACRLSVGLGEGQAFIPLHDQSFQEACEEWETYLLQWIAGIYPDRPEDMERTAEAFEEWHGPRPAERHALSTFRPDFETAPTCWQVYESVTEGTPISPVFDSINDLYRWLITDGGLDGPWSENEALVFVEPAVVG